MAKVAIKSVKLSPFGGIFSIMEQFDSNLSSVIDSTLGMRCRLYGYQYSEVIRSLSPLAPQAKATNSRGITEHALMRVDKSCVN